MGNDRETGPDSQPHPPAPSRSQAPSAVQAPPRPLRFAPVLWRDLRPHHTDLTGPPPPLDGRLRYHAAFGPVTFGAPHSTVVLPGAWLTLPLLRADPATHRDALAWCGRLTHTAPPQPDQTFDAQLRDCLRLQPPHDRDLGTVAALLGLHPRTVRHRLSRLGTTFREVRAGVLLDEAREWLTHTPDSTETVAQRLGFSDARSFRRALKAWTGHTPQQLRQHADRE